MIAAMKSEIRKLLSLRSTYVIFGMAMLLTLVMNGWVMGYKHGQVGSTLLTGVISSTFQGTSFLLGLIVLLQVTQEYRYNTIYYTMTLSRSRTAIFLSKILVATLVMFVGAAILMAAGVASCMVGVAISGDSIGVQNIAWSSLLPHGAVYVWGAGMYALLIGFILRNQVGTIVLYIFGINVAEQLLSLLLKSNAGYLPFRALDGALTQIGTLGTFSPEKSMAIVAK
jgi:ABC-type transport system involved in multi-copper enzyme maturation permease subunit